MKQKTQFDLACRDWLLYEDDDLVVINKPSGLLSVPGKIPNRHACVADYLHQTHPEALIVHRLDMDTSGILLLARHKQSHRQLSIQFQQRQTDKTYIALCQGRLPRTQGVIRLPMRCDWQNRPKQCIDFKQGRYAITEWQCLSQYRDYFRMQLHPITGRSHQLRLHMQALGHPILGDNLYADATSLARTERLMLHAEQLSFIHPGRQQPITINCPAPF